MELLETLFSNKKNFIILASIYFVVVIVVLICIWMPEKVSDTAKYEPYNEASKNEKMVKYYADFLEDLKKYGTKENFEQYIDSNYLFRNNMTLEEAIAKLKATDNSYVLKTYNVYKNGNNDIYSISIPSGKDELNVNIVERNYPYDFYITYDTFVNNSSLWYYGNLRGGQLKITNTAQYLNYIEYELTITNNNYDELSLDFSNASDFKLKLEDGSEINLNLVKSVQGNIQVDKGQTETAKLVFNVGIAEQSKITSLNISKIIADNSKLNATISFY